MPAELERLRAQVIDAARKLRAAQPFMRGGWELRGGELDAYQDLLVAVRRLEQAEGERS